MIKVRFTEGEITLDPERWEWHADSADDLGELRAELANLASVGYDCSPALGVPGYALATYIAKELGGEAVLPKVVQSKEQPIY